MDYKNTGKKNCSQRLFSSTSMPYVPACQEKFILTFLWVVSIGKRKCFLFNVHVINKKVSCLDNHATVSALIEHTLNHSIHTVAVVFFHGRTELNDENKVILLTNCDFILYTFAWFSEGLLDKRQHFSFNSINYPSFSLVSYSVATRPFTASHPKTGWRGFPWCVMGPKF